MLTSKLPLFIGVVVLLSFLLLAVVFRSLLVPAKAAVMNLLSVGRGVRHPDRGVPVGLARRPVFGVSRTGPVEAFLPVMLFAILFGLSMDYEVFLVMRIHEEWLRTGDNREAVRRGLAATGRTITAAAAIMVWCSGRSSSAASASSRSSAWGWPRRSWSTPSSSAARWCRR